MSDLEIKKVPISELQPWEGNPRSHKEDIDELVKSIEHYGWTNPILVQKGTMRVLAGHGRLLAAKEAGITEVPIIELELNERDATAYTIADNRFAEKSKWDIPKLKDALVGLDLGDFDIELTGYTGIDLKGFFDNDPAAQDPNGKKAKTCSECGQAIPYSKRT